jgi:hypothetical protein
MTFSTQNDGGNKQHLNVSSDSSWFETTSLLASSPVPTRNSHEHGNALDGNKPRNCKLSRMMQSHVFPGTGGIEARIVGRLGALRPASTKRHRWSGKLKIENVEAKKPTTALTPFPDKNTDLFVKLRNRRNQRM